ncbi:A24 family peptidase [Halodurantibacterium flavum]|uniref:Prepilin peptidase n=1 Tax=Halodurantibacterium flavum TaxID=1382802 RepID=A0ABW4S689_9RHOB
MPDPATLSFVVFATLTGLAAASDLWRLRIPNRIVLGLVAGYLVLLPWHLGSWGDVAAAMAAAGAVLVAGIVGFARGWFGGGDAKLAAAIALWLGPAALLPFLVTTAVLGGVLAFGVICLRPMSVAGAGFLPRWLWQSNQLPYGAALVPAALWHFPQGAWAAGWLI